MTINNITSEKNQKDTQSYFLSSILGAKVIWKGAKIGRLSDLVILDGVIAEVTHFYITRSFGNPSLLVPWEKVSSLGAKKIEIDIENIEKYQAEPSEGMVLLKDHIVDKKVLDIDGREVEVVYDVKLVVRNNKLYVTDVDLSRYGLLRRMGIKWLADFIYNLADKVKEQTISWSYVEPLPAQLSSFKGAVKLKVLKDKLSEIHPVDLADILEELEPEQRNMVFDQLDIDHASDTLEEISPNVQRMLIASLKKERVAQLLNEMTPGQAADVLQVIPASEADDIMKLLTLKMQKKLSIFLNSMNRKS
jgi:magnesium transporter